MPRKSRAALNVVPIPTPPQPRLTPTRPLSEAEQRHWLHVTSSLPSTSLDAVDAAALTSYVGHAAQAEQALQWLAEHGPADPQWARVNAVQALHSGKALAWARSLRLTRVARRDRDRAATDARRGYEGPVSFEQMLQNYRRQASDA